MKINKKILAHPVLVSSVVGVLLIVVGLFTYFGLTKTANYEYSKAEKRNITENVFVNGEVKTAQNVDASFEVSGKISDVYVSVGDKVYAGQALVKLVSDDESVNLAQAKAALASAKSQYEITKTQSENAKTALDEADKNLKNKIISSYTVADDVIRNNIDILFSHPRTDNPDFLLSINDFQATNKINDDRRLIEIMLKNWNTKNSDISADEVLSNLNTINSFLDLIAYGVNGLDADSGVDKTLLAQYKLTLSTTRASINNSISALLASEASFVSAQSAYKLSLQQITSSDASPMSSGEAAIAQAQANVDKAQVQLNKKVLRAPFDGVISDVNAKLGQVVSSNTAVVSMVSNGGYQIDSYVSEIDVAKLQVGQKATTTLDAYGSSVPFVTKVVAISPAETLKNGVYSYKITLQFESDNQQIRSGMNSNSYILVDSKENVLSVPESSIIKKGSDYYVMVKNNDKQDLKKVEIGIEGDNYVEITSGLLEGELVANFN